MGPAQLAGSSLTNDGDQIRGPPDLEPKPANVVMIVFDLLCRSSQGLRRLLALCGQVWYFGPRKIGGITARFAGPRISFRRFSSAVEQRFCKPKVGSSILSTGTI
jgi:hypothetical protein